MTQTARIPHRRDVPVAHTWDLGPLFADDGAWERAFQRYQKQIGGYGAFRGKLGGSARMLAACLRFDSRVERLGERLGTYAYLKASEDQTNSAYQRMLGRYQNAATRASELASFVRPEILAIPKAKMRDFLTAQAMRRFRLLVQRLLRYRNHTLGKKEESLLAMQGEMAETAAKAFRQLLDADLKFGHVKTETGDFVELTNTTLSQLLISPKRSVRETAFRQFYRQFASHENTLAAMLAGSIQKDVYYARARKYPGAMVAALFPDAVPPSVYDQLIATVRRHLPSVHHYYEVRRRKMRLKELHHYDTYVPIVSGHRTRYDWEDAVSLVLSALQPLGGEYCRVLQTGLRGRWCDRFANQGKQSGAFSYGGYDAPPYILMNYKPDVLEDVFTLAHEAGHSMHTYYSARHQPFEYYRYSIFVAEVASTFNEQLLSRYLMGQARDDGHRAYLINREVDHIRATLVRQTMFAEFEKTTHEMVEMGEPLTVQSLKDVYSKLLRDYFGPGFVIDEELALECLRIPHFYRAFYVYQYATGLSAAIALSERILQGGSSEQSSMLDFLKAGCARFPLEILRDAGVDMAGGEPVDLALCGFARWVSELETLI